ncbi:MAG TPA: SDR family oxidoreductase [Aggregatilineales bacterium]|nr:SDR family oxidoreductase [Aggregatilineales bacterium]
MKLMIIGGTSAIAFEAAKRFAAEGAEILILDREPERMEAVKADLLVRGAKRVERITAETAEVANQQALLDKAIELFGGIESVLIAYGTLSDQAACQRSVETTLKELHVNAISVIAWLTILANYFEQRRSGTIAVISSVAGDRGRGSNYVYGAAKATLTAFLSGLRSRMAKVGVSVLTVKPGMVDTPMTAHLRKSPLFASPQKVGGDIYRAMRRGQDVIYSPWYWRYIMLVIVLLPEGIFKRTRL